LSSIGHPDFETPFGPTIPAYYALIAQRHMAEYGTTREQLAQVATTLRSHAALHEGAHYRKPITIQEVLASKPIAEPLHMHDCCPGSEGGGACVVTTAKLAQKKGQRSVRLAGFGESHGHEHLMAARSLTESPAISAGQTAYAMAAVGPEEVDVALLYDCF